MKPAIERIADALEAISAKIGATTRTGEWVREETIEDCVTCSACGWHFNENCNDIEFFVYCPACGAKMDKEDTNDNR